MSYVADIILITALWDGSDNPDEPLQGNAGAIARYLAEHHHGATLELINDHAGGNKAMQCDLFTAAINYLDVPRFVSHFHSVRWENPECVQLLIKDEDDDRFSIYTPEESNALHQLQPAGPSEASFWNEVPKAVVEKMSTACNC